MTNGNGATKVHPVDVLPTDDAESGMLMSPTSTPGKKQTTFARGFGVKSFHKAPVSGLQEDGTAEVHTLYLVALWLTLRAPLSWRTFSLFSFSIFLGLLQTTVALNLAWILNDERVVDLDDGVENYETMSSPAEFMPSNVTNLPHVPFHKHVSAQNERYCSTNSTSNSGLFSVFVYYQCVGGFEQSMTTWDIFTVLLLCVAFFEKLNDSHIELMFQIVLGIVGLQERNISVSRRCIVMAYLAARCLQETLFVSISVIIVSAAKGTVQMIMNSLAVSFFADLDNMVWSKMLEMIPYMQGVKQQATDSLNGEFIGVTHRVEDGKLGTGAVSLAVTAVYFVGCIVYKAPTVYQYFDGLSPPDTNIPTSLFVLPICLMLLMLLKHASAMATEVISVKSDASRVSMLPEDQERPASRAASAAEHLLATAGEFTLKASSMIAFGISSMSISFFYFAVGIVEGVIGAHCAWRFSFFYASIVSIPTLITQALLHIQLTVCKSRSPLSFVLSCGIVLLWATCFAFALFISLAPGTASYTTMSSGWTSNNGEWTFSCFDEAKGEYNIKCLMDERLMGSSGSSFRIDCLCGYEGWTPTVFAIDKATDYCSQQEQLPMVFDEMRD